MFNVLLTTISSDNFTAKTWDYDSEKQVRGSASRTCLFGEGGGTLPWLPPMYHLCLHQAPREAVALQEIARRLAHGFPWSRFDRFQIGRPAQERQEKESR